MAVCNAICPPSWSKKKEEELCSEFCCWLNGWWVLSADFMPLSERLRDFWLHPLKHANTTQCPISNLIKHNSLNTKPLLNFCHFFSVVVGTPDRHEFQAETRKLLDIVAKSLYSEKEVSDRGISLPAFCWSKQYTWVGSLRLMPASLAQYWCKSSSRRCKACCPRGVFLWVWSFKSH